MREICVIFLVILASGGSFGSTEYISQTSTICLPFDEYEDVTKEVCRSSQEIVRLEEQKNAAQVEANLKQLMFEEKIRAMNDKLQAAKENCDLRLELAEVNTNQLKHKLEECHGALNKTQSPNISPEIAAQLTHLKTGTYFISRDLTNWYMAEILCRKYGLELASVEFRDENEELKLALEKGNFWLSGSKQGTGTFHWTSTGQPMSTGFGWGPGQPDSRTNEHCVHFINDVWNDNVCEARMGFVCEAK